MEQGGAAAGSEGDLSPFLGTEVAEILKGGQANQDMKAIALKKPEMAEYLLRALGSVDIYLSHRTIAARVTTAR